MHENSSTLSLFQQALRENSNIELDWLWLATRVAREGERRYCLEQALRINPCSVLAQKWLRQLTRCPDARLEPAI